MNKLLKPRFQTQGKKPNILLALLAIFVASGMFFGHDELEVVKDSSVAVVETQKKEEIKQSEEKPSKEVKNKQEIEEKQEEVVSVKKEWKDSVPKQNNRAYTIINNNIPYFTKADMSKQAFEHYSELDYLNRCGPAFACVGIETMPTEKRGSIGMIKPSGWHTIRYDDLIEGKYLYNRCHLIGYQLTAENANTKNLITGTRYLNMEGMLPFENQIADYIDATNNHVLYRVTPDFEGNQLVAKGVLMEAKSVEDDGEGLMFCVYAYNIQPGISIDYATGESSRRDDAVPLKTTPQVQKKPKPALPSSKPSETCTYMINVNTEKFHRPNCSSVSRMKEENKLEFIGGRQELINKGYAPCKNCNP